MSRKLYTTVEVSKAAGVPRATLQHGSKQGRYRHRSFDFLATEP